MANKSVRISEIDAGVWPLLLQYADAEGLSETAAARGLIKRGFEQWSRDRELLAMLQSAKLPR